MVRIKGLIFSRNFTIGSFIIRIFTNSYWSHVAIILSDGTVIDASAKYGVYRWPNISVYLSKHRRWFGEWKTFDLLKSMDIDGLGAQCAISNIGNDYDWGWILDFILRKDGNWDYSRKWVCSELVWSCLESLRSGSKKSRITPDDIIRSLGLEG